MGYYNLLFCSWLCITGWRITSHKHNFIMLNFSNVKFKKITIWRIGFHVITIFNNPYCFFSIFNNWTSCTLDGNMVLVSSQIPTLFWYYGFFFHNFEIPFYKSFSTEKDLTRSFVILHLTLIFAFVTYAPPCTRFIVIWM